MIKDKMALDASRSFSPAPLSQEPPSSSSLNPSEPVPLELSLLRIERLNSKFLIVPGLKSKCKP